MTATGCSCPRLKVFLFDGAQLFGIFVCSECQVMSSLEALESSQDPEHIRPKLCHHSLAASILIGDWRQLWTVNLSPSDHIFRVSCNEDVKFETFKAQSSTTSLLAGVNENQCISILYCATSRQEQPFCTTCVRRKCFHYKKLLDFYKSQRSEDQGNEAEQEEDPLEDVPRHDAEEIDCGYEDHYMKPMAKHLKGYYYGYNFAEIHYPFSDSSERQQVWLDKIKGSDFIPKSLVPIYDVSNKCKHEVAFNPEDDCLVRESQKLCLFYDWGERVYESAVFARPSIGPCCCLQRFDGDPLQIWNLGRGRFVDYSLLLGYLHKWRASGITMYALFRSIVDCAESCGITCSLTCADIHRSICGFCAT